MFDFDVGKMMVFAIVALAVIPPKDLPRVLRTVGKYVGQMRRMAADFQGQFMDAMKEADIEAVKKEFEAMETAAKVDSSFDPVMAMRSEMTRAVEGSPATVAGAEAPAEVAGPAEPFYTEINATPMKAPEAAPMIAGEAPPVEVQEIKSEETKSPAPSAAT